MHTFRLAKDKTTGKIVTIEKADRGLKCNCVCPGCGGLFIAAKGEKNDWHFRHHDDETTCNGGQETALHLLAKDIIVSNSKIILSSYGEIQYDDAVEEKYFQTIKPDVTAKTNGQNLFFEVVVSHPVDTVKSRIYKDGKHKSVGINLKGYTFTSRECLERAILKNPANVIVIFWEGSIDEEKRTGNSQIWLVLSGVLALLGVKFLLRRRR